MRGRSRAISSGDDRLSDAWPRTGEYDRAVRLHVYRHLVQHATAPAVATVARELDSSAGAVADAFRRLAAAHAIVLDADTPSVRFAAPFSAVPTAHTVRVGDTTYYAPCAWDALGIPAALRQDAQIHSTCPDCDDAVRVTVTRGAVDGNAALAHFHVPARHWWDDIGFT